jgi:hypothetical protein
MQGDRIRKIEGVLGSNFSGIVSGAFSGNANYRTSIAAGSSPYSIDAVFDSSLVVPTGPDNAPVNASVRIWRRTG